jgi:hypothetical protein
MWTFLIQKKKEIILQVPKSGDFYLRVFFLIKKLWYGHIGNHHPQEELAKFG